MIIRDRGCAPFGASSPVDRLATPRPPVRLDRLERPVARVVVDVMLKPEILDPQGKAVLGAMGRLGFSGVEAVRQGKRFEIEVDGDVTPEVFSELERAAGTLLANPVIEDYAIHVE